MSRGPANILWLGIKELRSVRADRILLFLILYSFSYAIYAVATGAKLEVEHVAVGIVDEDRSTLSRAISAAILEPFFRSPREIAASAIDAEMDAGHFVFMIEIPPHFEADLLAARAPGIQINVDATAMAQAGNGAIYLQTIIDRAVRDRLSRDGEGAPPPIDLVVRTRFNPNAQSHWFTAVMQIINNITILSVILTGAALIREREHGTVEHLLTMPVTPAQIMLAKIWANGLIVLAAALLSLRLVVELLLDVPIAGSLVLFVVGALLYQFAVTALGILIATFTTSMSQFGLLAMPILVVMNLLSGATTPLETMPVWLQAAMQLSPSTHFVGFAQAVLYRGADLAIVWPDVAAVAGISAAFFALALLRFRSAITSSR